MLQGYAGILAGNRRRRIAVAVLLANLSLVLVAALWRHAGGDDPALGAARADDGQIQSAPPAAAPSAELPATDALPTDAQPAPAPPADESSPALANDPVMEELRSVIRNPSSGLELPRLDESSPLTARVQASAHHSSLHAQQRIESLHSLSSAAVALVREARSLSDAGLTSESAALMHHAAKLRAMIAALAAQAEGQP